ncbi:thermonuclease family protein [Ruegeria marisrubri]|uniref:thermonuclease family protein n=1 Tax=Ruegeria marisrubri TaxID=1685379 RepID=UPI001CD1F2A3|nr:thermonuclease family protein [Ruegeria marisrubri]MCA0905118.1 thermonuclease family protein [Ruegeria marisrubri]
MSLYTYRARLTEGTKNHPIYDADTVRLTVDLGFGLTSNLGPCRLYGIDAPELRGDERPAGIAARDFLRDLIEPGQWFTVQTIKDAKGKYGRYLCKIVLDDGTNINELLVETGHAVAREY